MEDRMVSLKVTGLYGKPLLRPDINCDNSVNLSALIRRNTFTKRDLELMINLGYTMAFTGSTSLLSKQFIDDIASYTLNRSLSEALPPEKDKVDLKIIDRR